MLFYNKITQSEGLDTSGTDVVHADLVSSKWCDFFYFYFFKNRNFHYQPHVCNGCHDASLCTQSLTDFKIITIKSSVYRVGSNISCEEITCLLKSKDLIGKLGYF